MQNEKGRLAGNQSALNVVTPTVDNSAELLAPTRRAEEGKKGRTQTKEKDICEDYNWTRAV